MQLETMNESLMGACRQKYDCKHVQFSEMD